MTKKNTNKWINKRREILNIAENIFSEKGYKDTRLQDISDIMGMQCPSILYYFKNKNSLLDAVIQNVAEKISNIFSLYIKSGYNTENIYFATERVCEFLIANPSCARILVRQATDPQFPKSESSSDYIDKTIHIIREYEMKKYSDNFTNKYVYYFLSQIFLTSIWVSINNATKRSIKLDLTTPEALAFLRTIFQRMRLNIDDSADALNDGSVA